MCIKPDVSLVNPLQCFKTTDVGTPHIDFVMPNLSFNNITFGFLDFPTSWKKQLKLQKESKYIVCWDGRSQYLLDSKARSSKGGGHTPSYETLKKVEKIKVITNISSPDTIADSQVSDTLILRDLVPRNRKQEFLRIEGLELFKSKQFLYKFRRKQNFVFSYKILKILEHTDLINYELSWIGRDMMLTDISEVNLNDLMQWNYTVTEGVLESSVKQFTSHVSPGIIHETLVRGHGIYISLPKASSDNIECIGIDNTRRKLIRRKEPDDKNLIRRKKAKKGFQIAEDNNFTGHAPLTRDFGVLEKYVYSYLCLSKILTICVRKGSIFFGSMNKLIQEKPLADGYWHSVTDLKSSSCLNSSNWTNGYEASSKTPEISKICQEVYLSIQGVLSQYFDIPRKPPWLVFLLCKTLRREDAIVHCTPYPATTIMAKLLSKKGEDLQMLLVEDVHLGNLIFQMESFKGGDDSIYVINLGEILDKLVMAGMVTISTESQQDVIFQSAKAYEQRAVLKFAYYIGTQRLAVRHTLSTIVDNIKESKLYHLQVPWISVHIIVVSCREREYFTSALVYWHLDHETDFELLGETVIQSCLPDLQSLIFRIRKPVTTAGRIMEIYRSFNEIYKEHVDGVRIGGDRFFNVHRNTTMKTQGSRTFDPGGTIVARLKHDALFCSRECVGILPAMLMVSDKGMDNYISWVPIYNEAKLTFFIYLWNPKTEGTTYVYESFSRPYLVKHETEIERIILEMRLKFTENSLLKATDYGQTRADEIMGSVATPKKRKSKPTQERHGTVTKQTSTLALNNQLAPFLEEKLLKQQQTRSSKDAEGNIPAPMISPPTRPTKPTLEEGLLEIPKQSPLGTKSSSAQMKVFPKFIDNIQLCLNYTQGTGSTDNVLPYAHCFHLCLWYKDDSRSQEKMAYYLARLQSTSTIISSFLTDTAQEKSFSFSTGFDKIMFLSLCISNANYSEYASACLHKILLADDVKNLINDDLRHRFLPYDLGKDACAIMANSRYLIDDQSIQVDFIQSLFKLWSEYKHKNHQTSKGKGCFKCGTLNHIPKDCTADLRYKAHGSEHSKSDESRHEDLRHCFQPYDPSGDGDGVIGGGCRSTCIGVCCGSGGSGCLRKEVGFDHGSDTRVSDVEGGESFESVEVMVMELVEYQVSGNTGLEIIQQRCGHKIEKHVRLAFLVRYLVAFGLLLCEDGESWCWFLRI
ncbi:hypothetical protein C5167_019154 [Papaver somniferum]|uniref:CCHC-type domain-containing protein n=1 Tax=Papaver somniferum TaxID=3469 RepID=A0A4Y7IT90_PAPSO|nr:hypothetical protein C5167_019154 [Papaver somniferum]